MKEKGFVGIIQNFETNFSIVLKQLIDALKTLSTTEGNHHTANLVLRLDFNDFYRNYFETNPMFNSKSPTNSVKTPTQFFDNNHSRT